MDELASFEMLLVLMENNLQGRIKMIEDGIMDKDVKTIQRNGTDSEEVALSQR